MEKRRVRIYKAGGQQGSYVNKTANYFQKGGMQTSQTLDDNQLISIMMKRLSMDDDTANMQYAENDLAQLNIEPERIKKLSRYVLNYIDDQKSLQDAQQTGDEETAAKLQAEEDSNQQIVQDEEELLAQQQQQRQQQLQEIYNDDSASADNGDYDQAESDIIMRDGGISNKRAFISNFIKLAKKAEGGNTEEKKPDIKTDIPIGGRTEKVTEFYKTLVANAENAKLKEQAEEAYKQEQEQLQQMPLQGYAQDGGDTESGVSNFDPYHNLEHYSGAFEHSMPFNALTEAQFGGFGHGKERRAARRMGRMMPQGFNQMNNMMGNQMINPFMQQQMSPLAQFMPNQGNLGLANIDVRRTGIFGRPKEYTINFNTASPITVKDIEDTQKQEVNNAETTKKEVEEIIKEEETNTASTKNAEVAKASETLPDAENIYVVDNKVKKNSGKSTSSIKETNAVIPPVVTTPVGTTPVAIPPVNTLGSTYGNANTPADMFFYNSDKPGYNYTFDNNKLMYKTGEGDFTNTITDPARIKELQSQLKGADLYTLPSKPGFYYRQKADGSYVKFKGDPKNYSSTNKPIGVITPKDPTYTYLNKNKSYSYSVSNPVVNTPNINPITGRSFNDVSISTNIKQEGGFTNQESGLYRFMGGGEDFTQYDLDYSDSKNVSSPYFQSGGYFQTAGQTNDTVVDILDKAGNVIRKGTLAEAERAGLNHRIAATTKELDKTVTDNNVANIDYAQRYLQSIGMQMNPFAFMPPSAITPGANWNKAVGSLYGTKTLNPISGMIGPNAQVSSINVDKTRMFGPNKGTPKKFTVNYNIPGQNGVVNPIATNTTNSQSGERTRGVIRTADRPESRASSMYRRLTEKDFAPTEKNSIYDNNGMPTNDYAPGVIENLRKSPISALQYRTDQADENQADRQAWDLERLRLQNRAYGGESLPKAQFGPANQAFGPEEEKDNRDYIPPGYYFNAAKGQYENSAGVKYDPATKVNSFFSADIDKSGVPDYLQKSDDQQISQKFKNKQEWNIDAKGALDFGNMAGNAFAGFADRAQEALQNRNIGSKFDASNLYAQTDTIDKGGYDQLGQFKPNETGFKKPYSYGGYMEEGGSYEEGGDTWMSEEQIQQFLAEGGELEFV